MKPLRYILCVLVTSGILIVNAQNGTWKVLQTKSDIADRSECGMAVSNGKIYLVGGDGGGAQSAASFDPATSIWKELAKEPVMMHHLQAVTYNDKIYILEAFAGGGFPNQEPMPNVYDYNIKTDAWEQGGEMPAARRRAGAAAALYKGKMYLVAGIQHGHSSGTTNMFDVYDPETQTWQPLPDAPHIRDHCSAAVIKDKLYIVGGRNTSFRDPDNKITFFSQTMLDVDCYDFTTGKWSTLPAKLPLGTGGGAVVNLHDVLYYIGGERATATEQNAPRKNVYYLNPETQTEWKAADTLHYGRNGMAAVVLNNKIYVAGGSGGGMGGPGGPGMPPPGGGFNPNMPRPDSTMQHQQMPPNMNGGNQPHNNLKIEVFSLN